MRLAVFAVFDEKAKAFLPPFFLPNTAMALRTFGDCVNMADHQFGRHPSDYTLFSFGFFDQVSGKFEVPGTYELVANGVMCLKVEGEAKPNGGVSVNLVKESVHENA